MTTLVLDDFIPYRLSVASNLVSDAIAGAYEALFGLSIAEWRVIAGVAEQDGLTQAAVGARTRMDKVTVSRAAIALAGRGLLQRGVHADRRARGLTLTAAGQELYAQVAPKALDLEARILAGFSREEVDGFAAMLRRLEAVALRLQEGTDA